MFRFKRVTRIMVAPRGPLTLTERPPEEGSAFHLTVRDLDTGKSFQIVLPRTVWVPIAVNMKACHERLTYAEREALVRDTASTERMNAAVARHNLKVAFRTVLKNATPRSEATDFKLMRLRTAAPYHVETFLERIARDHLSGV